MLPACGVCDGGVSNAAVVAAAAGCTPNLDGALPGMGGWFADAEVDTAPKTDTALAGALLGIGG